MLLFKNRYFFTFLFLCVLLIDIVTKLYLPPFPYRVVSKPLVVLLLLVYFIVNAKRIPVVKYKVMIVALIMFALGDLFLIYTNYTFSFIIGMLFFVAGKIMYCIRFSTNKDFSINRIIPFFIGCFSYIVLLISLVYDNLKILFLPVLVYIFITLLAFLMAFIRKRAVNTESYYMVFFGVFLFILADSLVLIDSFYNPNILFSDAGIMLFYGAAQYLIIMGITHEKYFKMVY